MYWSGPDAESLQGVANVADRYATQNGGEEHDLPERAIDDGSTMHAPVGSYRANRFGLYDVHGNVYEWCLDGYDRTFYGVDHGRDPVAPWTGEEPRVYRGGSYRIGVGPARSAARNFYPPDFAGHALGVRPVRAIAN